MQKKGKNVDTFETEAMTQSGPLIKFITFLSPPTLRDSEDEGLKVLASSLILISALSILACPLWSIAYLNLGLPLAAAIPLLYVLFSIAGLIVFRLTARYHFFRLSQLILILFLPAALQWSLGGFSPSSAVILWSSLSPMAALMFLKRKRAIPWFVAFIAIIAVSVVFDAQLPPPAKQIPATLKIVFYFLNICVPLTIIYAGLHNFVQERDDAFARSAQMVTELHQHSIELEHKNAVNKTALKRLQELGAAKDLVFRTLSRMQRTQLPHLQQTLTCVSTAGPLATQLQQTADEINTLIHQLQPVLKAYDSEQAIRSKRILLAENHRLHQAIAKMALRGTGIELKIASSYEKGLKRIEDGEYNLVCLAPELWELGEVARKKNQEVKSVYFIAEDVKNHLQALRDNPHINNVVCRSDSDHTFTIKNILTTASKLLNADIFGIEKYLAWGVEVVEKRIVSSEGRSDLIDDMVVYLKECGMRGGIQRRAITAAEELLSNSIYDAPGDARGKSLYNHLHRSEAVTLSPEMHGRFRYACDGMLVAVSVEDPFGGLTRDTIIDYLIDCYHGASFEKKDGKGGAGHGLFQVMQASSLVIFNVRKGQRTEVIALFNVNLQMSKSKMDERSFHFFYE